MTDRRIMEVASFVLATLALSGCAGVKPLSRPERDGLARFDTVYVLPSVARYTTKGFVFNRIDRLRTERLQARLDSLLPAELQRALPGAVILRGDGDDLRVQESARVRLRAAAFRRTLPRQVASDITDIVLMVPTFGRSMARPMNPASKVRLEVVRPGARRAAKAYHEDEVNADDLREIVFQVRKLLDPGYRG
jgi:hypothetical protein